MIVMLYDTLFSHFSFMRHIAIQDMDTGGPEIVPVFYDDFWPIHYARDIIDLASIVWQPRLRYWDFEYMEFPCLPIFELVRI